MKISLNILVAAPTFGEGQQAIARLTHFRPELGGFKNSVEAVDCSLAACDRIRSGRLHAVLMSYRLPWASSIEKPPVIADPRGAEGHAIFSREARLSDPMSLRPYWHGPTILAECILAKIPYVSFFHDDYISRFLVECFESRLHDEEYGGRLTSDTMYVRGKTTDGNHIKWEFFLETLARIGVRNLPIWKG